MSKFLKECIWVVIVAFIGGILAVFIGNSIQSLDFELPKPASSPKPEPQPNTELKELIEYIKEANEEEKETHDELMRLFKYRW